MITKYGNIFETTAPILGHGVNCKGLMGAGIAKQFRAHFGNEMYEDYANACRTGALVPGKVHAWKGDDRWCFNIASQNKPGKDAREAWLTSALINAADVAENLYGRALVAIPTIGCGIGGLHVDALERSIQMAEQAYPETVFELWFYES